MGAALKFKQTAVPRQKGETARAKVVRGPDYGAVYVFTGNSATIGRGEDNDIVISDLKASRRHAEFLSTPQGWAVRDLGSANGITVNGKATRNAPLATKDTVALGETVLEFLPPEAGTMVLLAPPRTIEQVQSEQIALEEQKKKVQGVGRVQRAASAGPAAPGGATKAPPNKRMLIYGGGIALVAVMLLMGGGNDKQPAGNGGGSGGSGTGKKKGKGSENVASIEDLARFMPGNEPGVIARSADSFFRAGFREYKTKNYLRAKQQFETVLQMIPGQPLAQRYLEAVQKEIQDEVKQRMDAGSHCMEGGKYRDARGHFQAVLRLLFWNPQDPNYVEAKKKLEEVERLRLKDTPGELPAAGGSS